MAEELGTAAKEATSTVIMTIAAHYRSRRGLGEEQFFMGGESDFFSNVVGQLIDVDHETIIYWAFLEPCNDDWLLVLIADELRLARFGKKEAELRFLGRLEGDYVERIEDTDGRVNVVLSFRDDRLPGGVEFEGQPGSSHLERLQPLRDCFRAWSRERVR